MNSSAHFSPTEEENWLLDEIESLEIDWGFSVGRPTSELTVFCDNFCSDEVILESSPLTQILKKVPEVRKKPSPFQPPIQEKELTCPYAGCGKRYGKASHLRAHLRRHTGEKPFNCSWPGCQWKFSRSDELARHIRSHSGLKPYVCANCFKRFGRSDHLGKHSKVHTRRRGVSNSDKEIAHFDLTAIDCSTLDDLWYSEIVLENQSSLHNNF